MPSRYTSSGRKGSLLESALLGGGIALCACLIVAVMTVYKHEFSQEETDFLGLGRSKFNLVMWSIKVVATCLLFGLLVAATPKLAALGDTIAAAPMAAWFAWCLAFFLVVCTLSGMYGSAVPTKSESKDDKKQVVPIKAAGHTQ